MLGAVRRGLGVLFRAAPVAAPMQLLVSVGSGVAPLIVVVSGARLIGLAPSLAESPAARSEAVTAVLVLGAASIAAQAMAAIRNLLASYVGFQVDSAFEAQRMAAACALPGLEHFESSEHADRLALSARAVSFPKSALSTLVFGVHHGAQSIASLVVMARLGWWAPTLVAASSVPAMVVAWRHAGTRNVLARAATTEMRLAYYHSVLPLTDAARESRLFGAGPWLRARQALLARRALDPHLAEVGHQFRVSTLVAAAKGVAMAVPMVIAVVQFSNGAIGSSAFAAVAMAIIGLGPNLGFFEAAFGRIREDTAFLPDAFEVVDLPLVDPRLDVSGSAPAPRRPESGIRFQGVSFRYPGTDRLVLDGLDLVLPAGQAVALVGENGAGKSTLVKLLCRMYDPTQGRITLDGVDLRDFDLASLRHRMAVLTQSFLRIPAPVATNIGIGCPDRLEDWGVLEAAAADGGADTLIAGLGDGWATVLGKEFGGVDLSGGEWQRIALARVMAARHGADASILVLDEPTASLDVRLEHALFGRFAAMTRGATTLLISHRFSTVQMADRVALLDGGRIVEEGTHDALVSRPTRYSQLYRLQADRFRIEDPA